MKKKDPEKARRIGERITEARKAAGMTQRELGELIGVTERSIQAYEQGEVIPWRFGGALETALNRPMAWFWYGDEATALNGSEANLLQMVLTELRALRSYMEGELVEIRAELEPRSKVEGGRVADRPTPLRKRS